MDVSNINSFEPSFIYRLLAPKTEIIDESTWMPYYRDEALSAAHVLASTITKGLMRKHFSYYYETCNLPAESETFHRRAELLLRAASPGGFTLGWKLANNEGVYDAIYQRRCGSFHKYRDCAILCTGDLSTPAQLETNVVRAVAHAQSIRSDRCTVIIFSIRHVAVVQITGASLGNLHISHSKAHPFFDFFEGVRPSGGLNSYGLIAKYLRPFCVDGAILTPDQRTRMYAGSQPSLPHEVLQRIMNETSTETYATFGLVCKLLRREWFLHPRVCDHTIISGKEMRRDNNEPCSVLRAWCPGGLVASLYVFCDAICRYGKEIDDIDEPATDDFDSDSDSDEDNERRLRSHYPGPGCCTCENLCPGKKCRWPVGLRMPPRDYEILQKAMFGYWGPPHPNYFPQMFSPGLFVLDKDSACERCVTCARECIA